MRRHRILLLLTLIVLVGIVGALFCFSPHSSKAVGLKFLNCTNNGHARIVLFEITNQSADAFTWTLYADGREPNHRVAVTELMETDGQMRHIGSGGPLKLFGHDSLKFGTDELNPTEKRVWVSIQPYPMTRIGLQRERLAAWLYRLGWHSGAYAVKRGTRVDAPVLP
jgi:hypothetical protein